MNPNHPDSGFRTFLTIWAGQFFSLIGSGLTAFALGLWVLQNNGSVTEFALISLCTVLPRILVSPIAGALVDRWDRRFTMMASDTGAAISTAVLAILAATGSLATWHIYLVVSAISICSAFQWPAYMAATTVLVSKDKLGQASGMVQAAQGVAQTVTPVLAGSLIGLAGFELTGIILIDAVSFVFAMSTLAFVRIPAPKKDDEAGAEPKSLSADVRKGWAYLSARRALLVLLGFLAACNFLLGMITVLVSPLVLSFASPAMLGTVMTCAGMGMFAGSVLIGVWGGPRQKVHGVLGFMLLSGAALLPTGLAESSTLIAAGAFVFLLCVPVISGCSMTIMQSKVDPAMQGRVFSFSEMICAAAMPLAFGIAGPIADRVFEPLLALNGTLADSVGQLIGVGPGRGIALAFMVCGVLFILLSVVGFLYKPLRNIQSDLPDPAKADGGSPSSVECLAQIQN
jgi:DHA3 family macrolide efflux protein-like MFS transporter